jgi:hypothetical protein
MQWSVVVVAGRRSPFVVVVEVVVGGRHCRSAQSAWTGVVVVGGRGHRWSVIVGRSSPSVVVVGHGCDHHTPGCGRCMPPVPPPGPCTMCAQGHKGAHVLHKLVRLASLECHQLELLFKPRIQIQITILGRDTRKVRMFLPCALRLRCCVCNGELELVDCWLSAISSQASCGTRALCRGQVRLGDERGPGYRAMENSGRAL